MRKNLWDQVIRQAQNIDLYLTILGSGVVVVLGIFGIVKPEIVSTAILAILGLVAISLLSNRRTGDTLQQLLQQIQESNQETQDITHQSLQQVLEELREPPLNRVFLSWHNRTPELRMQLSQAREVWILTRSGLNFWASFQQELLSSLNYGGTVRLILLDPNSNALDQYKNRFEQLWAQVQSASLISQRVQALIMDLDDLSSQLSDGKLEIQTTDYMSPWILVLINPEDSNGIIQVGLSMFGPEGETIPSFVVKAGRDRYWFEVFSREFDAIWNSHQSESSVTETG